MKNRVATRDGDRRAIEQVADVPHSIAVQHIRQWIMAHRLDACRVCTGFRIDELGLADLISSPYSERRQRQRRMDGSSPRFASAQTSRR